MASPHSSKRNWSILIAIGLGLALLITLFSPFASSNPDGLEKVAEDKAFLEEAEGSSYEIIPDYTFPGVENERAATILSGIVGVLLVAGLGLGVGYGMKLLARSRADQSSDGASSGSRSAEPTGS